MHISLDSALGRQRRLNSVGESVLQIAPDAAAAYSLRSLTGGDPDVVRVRRESDNTEKDFSGSQIESGEMARWVNEQPTLPLDLRELDTNTGERDGALIEAAAAYSLRKLKEDFTADVVEVRRNVDGETEGFTADEVTDGTLESWVEGWELYTPSTKTRIDNPYWDLIPTDNQNFQIISNNADSESAGWIEVKLVDPQDLKVGRNLVTFDVTVNSGTLNTGVTTSSLSLYGRDGSLSDNTSVIRQLNAGFNSHILETVDNAFGYPISIFLSSGPDSKFDVTISNLKVYKSTVNELPLDQATGAAAAYSLRNLSSSFTGDVVEVRRSSDDAVQSFTASEVADGTLEDWVNVGNDYVGYARFQDAITSNVILSSSFTLEASKSWSIKFEYIGGDAITGLFGNTSFGNGGFWFANNTTIGLTDDSDSYQALSFGAGLALNIGQNYEIEFFNTPSEGVRVAIDGTTMLTTPKVYGDITIDRIGLCRGRDGERVIHNVRVDLNGDGTLDYSYAGDGNQASNWVDRVGSNNGTPAAQVLTYNNEYTDGFVRTWYDQSGSDNHAVQTTPAKQPKIVEGGNLLEGGVTFDQANETQLIVVGDPVITADYTGTYSAFSIQTVSNSEFGYLYGNASPGTGSSLYNNGSVYAATNKSTASGFDQISKTSEKDLLSAVYNNGDAGLLVNGGGTMIDQGTYDFASGTGDFRIGNRAGGTSGGQYLTGSIEEIIVYNSDQSTKRRAIEENIANHYDITLAAFSRDGTVSTWYDQSGNTNHATQTDPTNQPKIVEGGTLLKDSNNNPEVDFDGAGDTFVIDFGADLTQANSIFMVHQSDTTSSSLNEFFDSAGAAAPRTLFDQSGTDYRINSGVDAGTGVAVTTDQSLVSVIYNGASSLFAKNGTATGALDAGSTPINQNSTLGSSDFRFYDGTMQEFIIYNSDQSDNRTAIEANIGETYGITDIPAANDTVNGFVQTWYDQSGNVPANDAVQSAAAAQPKIVNEGTLIDSGILFSGGTQNLETSSTYSFGNNPVSVFSRLKLDIGASGFFLNLGAQSQFINVASGLRRMRAGVNANAGNSTNETEIWSVLFNPVSQGGDPETFAVNGNFYVDGVRTSIEDANVGTQVVGDGRIQIANRTNETDGIEGAISEVIVYDSNQSSNRPLIESNIENGFKEVNLWLTGGQSNSVGIQSSTSNVTDSSYDSANEINMIAGGWENTHVYANDGYPTMDYQPQQQWIKYSATNNSGPDRGFARRLAETYDNVRIAKFAVNGKDLDRYFKKSGSGILNPLYQAMIDQFNDAISKLRAGGYKVNLRGFFWSHGYSDSDFIARASNYETNLNNFISDIRNDLKHIDAESMPFLVAKNAPFWTTVGDTTVETAKSNVAAADSNVELVDTSSLTARDVTVHYDAASYEELGKRAADVFTSNF